VTSILTPLEGGPHQSSAGALLRVLELDIVLDDIRILVEALATKRCQLETLSLLSLNDANGEQFIRYLPDMTSLRNLKVTRMWDFDPSTFLRALRQNGSLQTVPLATRVGRAVLRTAECLQMQSYCDRNRGVTGLLQKLDDDGLMRSEDATFLSLCPLLLHAVKPATRMAPSVVIEIVGHLGCCKSWMTMGLCATRTQPFCPCVLCFCTL
jgi:hypothetical protein